MSDHWIFVKVADCLASVNRDKTPTIPAPEYLSDGLYPIIDQGVKPIGGWTNNAEAVIRNGLPVVVFGDVSRTLKYVSQPFARGAQGTQVLRTVPSVDQHFFYYSLKHLNLPSRGYNRHFVTLKDQLVSLPPTVEEQKAIASVLDEAESASLAEAHAAQHAETLKRAVMQELFSRGLRGGEPRESEVGPIPEGWVSERLGDSQSVSSGGTPSRGTDEYWTDGTIPWVKTAEVKYSVISTTSEHITQAGLDNSAAKLLPAGTVLIAMYGQGATRGKVGILGIDAATNQACAAIQPKSEAVGTQFLYHLLAGRYEELRSLAHGGQQQNLNLDIIRDFPISYPTDVIEQQAIVAILDALDARIALHWQKKVLFEEIFQALLDGLMSREIDVNDLDLSALPSPEEVLA